jgi:hypothetical protein
MGVTKALTLVVLTGTMAWICIACRPSIPGISSTQTKPERYLSRFLCIAGTPYQFATVQSSSDGGYSSLSGSSYGAGMDNVLFMNGEGNFSKLLETNDYKITGLHQFPNQTSSTFTGVPDASECGPESEKVEGFLYQVVKADSNGDKQITSTDLITLAISEPSGQGYTELIPNVKTLYGQAFQREPRRLVVVYGNAEGHFSSSIDLTTKQVVATNPLPDLGL